MPTRIKKTVEIIELGMGLVWISRAIHHHGDSRGTAMAVAQGMAEYCLLRSSTDKFTFTKVTNGCVLVQPLFIAREEEY
jgi:hypothetical protein